MLSTSARRGTSRPLPRICIFMRKNTCASFWENPTPPRQLCCLTGGAHQARRAAGRPCQLERLSGRAPIGWCDVQRDRAESIRGYFSYTGPGKHTHQRYVRGDQLHRVGEPRGLIRGCRGYFSNSASLTAPQLALTHLPCIVFFTVMALLPELTTTLILPFICVPPLTSKCTSLTVF